MLGDQFARVLTKGDRVKEWSTFGNRSWNRTFLGNLFAREPVMTRGLTCWSREIERLEGRRKRRSRQQHEQHGEECRESWASAHDPAAIKMGTIRLEYEQTFSFANSRFFEGPARLARPPILRTCRMRAAALHNCSSFCVLNES